MPSSLSAALQTIMTAHNITLGDGGLLGEDAQQQPSASDEEIEAEVYTFYRVQPILQSELDQFFSKTGAPSSSISTRSTTNSCSRNMRPFFDSMLANGLLRQTIQPILPIVGKEDGAPTTVRTLKDELLIALKCGTRPIHTINKGEMPDMVGTKGFTARFGPTVNNHHVVSIPSSPILVGAEACSSSPLGDVFSLRYDQELVNSSAATEEGDEDKTEEDAKRKKTSAPPSASNAVPPTIPRPPSSSGSSFRRAPSTKAPSPPSIAGEFVDLTPSMSVNKALPDVAPIAAAANSPQNQLFMSIHSNDDQLASLPRNSRLYVIVKDVPPL